MVNDLDPTVLTSFPCFQELTPQQAAVALQHFEIVRLTPGQVLCKERERGDAAYMLISGYVDVTKSVPREDDHRLATLTPGAIFGEVSLLTGDPRTASVIARTEAEVLRIPHAAYRQGLAHEEPWALAYLSASAVVLARRLTAVNNQLISVVVDLREWEAQGAGPDHREIEELRKELFEHWAL
jgi:CRP/FNR family transcriptional regulator, cyclic AMP receptor protein